MRFFSTPLFVRFSPHFVRTVFALSLVFSGGALFAATPQTERQYLSGHGPKDAVPWEFSVTGGRRAGEWTTIPVPSNWEQHGFGGYDYGEGAPKRFNEHGLYRFHFSVPKAWQGRAIRIVFEGAMTDATVKVNGVSAGPTHVGAFYRFSYDVTSIVKLGDSPDNVVEVDVAKVSANARTEAAERQADYWVFGGIFRPVWLEAAPMQSIEHTAIDARADGTFSAEVTLTAAPEGGRVEAQILSANGQPVGAPFSTEISGDRSLPVKLNTKIPAPLLWTAETPHLYKVELTLRKGDALLHTASERFGFRTFEVRKGEGFFLNGKRILLKGVNRHSFRPDTARALNREDSYEDARLIKEMNMNTARMSHYPPDEAFLEAADELGLYVLDELSGWHHSHDTEVGRRLVHDMVVRDVNHPSILFWDNGNEGGWNRELDGDFALHDPQHRHVLHPWELHDNVDTKHYPKFDDLVKRLQGPHILMPTEFIHALYDGGGGAGLADYWKEISTSPFGGGGIIWVFADEGIVRTDQGGRVDVYSTYAPDGLVGPRHEKEGSFYTVRQVWSPIQIAAPVLDAHFDGRLTVNNRYDFNSLSTCGFTWQLVRYRDPGDKNTAPIILSEGRVSGPEIAPNASGQLDLALPKAWRQKKADALVVTAYGPDKKAVWTWSWAAPTLSQRLAESVRMTKAAAPTVQKTDGEVRLIAGNVTASFDAATGLIRSLRHGDKTSALTNGPRLVFARPGSAGPVEWLPFAEEAGATQTRRLAAPHLANTIEIELAFDKAIHYAGFKLEISSDGQSWKTIFDGTRRAIDGKGYQFPPQQVLAVRLSNLHNAEGQEIALKSLRLGYAAARFPLSSPVPAVITTGVDTDKKTGESIAWLEAVASNGMGNGALTGSGLDRHRWSLRSDGTLKLDYQYSLDGTFVYHGITFDHPEAEMKSLRWLGEGPYRVWQNRLQGTWLGVHEIARNEIQPGDSWGYPELQGFFAGLRWARLETNPGALTVTALSSDAILRVGTPRISHQNTSVEFPAGDLSFMQAIPAMGSKFVTTDQSGPSSERAKAAGQYRGTLSFHFTE